MKASSLSGECATVISRISLPAMVAIVGLAECPACSHAWPGARRTYRLWPPLTSNRYGASPAARCRSPRPPRRPCSISESHTRVAFRLNGAAASVNHGARALCSGEADTILSCLPYQPAHGRLVASKRAQKICPSLAGGASGIQERGEESVCLGNNLAQSQPRLVQSLLRFLGSQSQQLRNLREFVAFNVVQQEHEAFGARQLNDRLFQVSALDVPAHVQNFRNRAA